MVSKLVVDSAAMHRVSNARSNGGSCVGRAGVGGILLFPSGLACAALYGGRSRQHAKGECLVGGEGQFIPHFWVFGTKHPAAETLESILFHQVIACTEAVCVRAGDPFAHVVAVKVEP